MDKLVAQLNLKHFREKLAQEDDPARQAELRNLLEEEELKLKLILARESGEQPRSG